MATGPTSMSLENLLSKILILYQDMQATLQAQGMSEIQAKAILLSLLPYFNTFSDIILDEVRKELNHEQ